MKGEAFRLKMNLILMNLTLMFSAFRLKKNLILKNLTLKDFKRFY